MPFYCIEPAYAGAMPRGRIPAGLKARHEELLSFSRAVLSPRGRISDVISPPAIYSYCRCDERDAAAAIALAAKHTGLRAVSYARRHEAPAQRWTTRRAAHTLPMLRRAFVKMPTSH